MHLKSQHILFFNCWFSSYVNFCLYIISISSTNVIIYTGDRHAERYRKFLKEKLNFDQIAQSGLPKTDKKPIYCLDMKTIPQPLFSTWPPEFYIDKKVDIKKGFWKRIFGLK